MTIQVKSTDGLRFVQLLAQMTRQGKVQWLRCPVDSDVVYCFFESEMCVFELRGAEAQPVSPEERVAMIRGEMRNVVFVWFGKENGGLDLLTMIRNAQLDEEAYRAALLNCRQAVFSELNAMISS